MLVSFWISHRSEELLRIGHSIDLLGHIVVQSKLGDGTKWQTCCRYHKVIYYFKVSWGMQSKSGTEPTIGKWQTLSATTQWWSSSPRWVRDCACSTHHQQSRELRIFFSQVHVSPTQRCKNPRTPSRKSHFKIFCHSFPITSSDRVIL